MRGWDYPALVETYRARGGDDRAREHVPAIVHVIEVTQPQGHSTSGSHERYKSKERLAWEEEFDRIAAAARAGCSTRASPPPAELDAIEKEEASGVRDAQRRAWDAYRAPIQAEQRRRALALLDRPRRRVRAERAAVEAIVGAARAQLADAPRRHVAWPRRSSR